MEWIDSITKAIDYIESNLTDELTPETVADFVHISPFYFQKGFSMLCGFTIGDYIRQRRLALAASDVVSGDEKIIDIALKYGYDSPDSFTKAFTRFHGITPTAARKGGVTLKTFTPLKILFSLKGGFTMNYKIENKDAFKVVGVSKNFKYDEAKAEIPKFWTDYFKNSKDHFVCGMFGINIDETMGGKNFEYLIADAYDDKKNVPDGYVVKTIPSFTWAVFPCVGSMPNSMQSIFKEIFSEWLPNCKEYEFAAGYNIEMYADPSQFPNGVRDDNYYSEIWIPVKKK